MIKTDQSGSGAKSQDAEFKRQVECGLPPCGVGSRSGGLLFNAIATLNHLKTEDPWCTKARSGQKVVRQYLTLVYALL
jgi:hypothetical protein